MASRNPDCRSLIAGQGRLAVACVVLSLSGVTRADDMIAAVAAALPEYSLDAALQAPDLLADGGIYLGTWDSSLAAATFFDKDFQSNAAAAPASELSAGLGVEVDQKRRKFRARVVDFMADRSASFGRMTDFLLGGADSGWHLVVDPIGEDEYVLEWKAKFR